MPDPTPLQVPASVKRNRRRRLIRRILAAVAVVAVVVGVFLVRNRKQDEGQDVMAGYETVQVERRTITEELHGHRHPGPCGKLCADFFGFGRYHQRPL